MKKQSDLAFELVGGVVAETETLGGYETTLWAFPKENRKPVFRVTRVELAVAPETRVRLLEDEIVLYENASKRFFQLCWKVGL